MARKRTITQRSFIYGEIREDFLEADDLELRGASVRGGLNCRITAARTLEARPGFALMRQMDSTTRDVIEIQPETGLLYGIVITDTALQIIDNTARLVKTISPVPWFDASTVWVEPFRERTVIGGIWGMRILNYLDGAWSLDDFQWAGAAGNELAQAYWSFRGDVQITPSALTGSITITATQALWTPAYVGQRIRYGFREIIITGYSSPTVLTGTVVSSLPPSFRLTVASGSSFRVGDAVTAADTDFQGVVLGITGNTINVATTSFFDGPDINEVLTGPSGGSKVTAKVQIAPLASPVWDEPLFSPVRGWARAGAAAGSRLFLVDHPLVPDIVCCSSVRDITDFTIGADDDDGIARRCGDNSPRFMHAINAGDLLLLADKGLYYVSVRDAVLTPSSFNAIQFDKRGSSAVRPVAVQDGVVFVEASGQEIAAALLQGNIYLKWSVKTISTNHSHLIKSPTKLCGVSIFSASPEKYLFIVNGDGTLAALSWVDTFNVESVGFLPWATAGDFKSMSPIFGGYWAITDRLINGTMKRLLERMDDDYLVDAGTPVLAEQVLTVNGANLTVNGANLTVVASAQTIFANETVRVYGAGWDYGDVTVGSDGIIPGEFVGKAVAGFNFEARALMWPQEVIQSERGGIYPARTIQGSVSVLQTGRMHIRCNANTRKVGGYSFGDDLTAPPPDKTRKYRFPVMGMRDHPEIEIIKPGPGRMAILAVTHEVTY